MLTVKLEDLAPMKSNFFLFYFINICPFGCPVIAFQTQITTDQMEVVPKMSFSEK